MLRLATALVVGLAFALPASAATLTLASRYDVSGTNTDGSKYSGTATVDVISDATFTIHWNIAGSTYTGFGMRMNASRDSSSTRSTTAGCSTGSGPSAGITGTAPSG
jgi:hypothetical protein